MRKKKIIFLTDFPLTKSGFGRSCKSLLEYLFRTYKYEIINVSVGIVQGNPELDRLPYKCIGAINPIQLNQLKQVNKPESHGEVERHASYGEFSIDEIVKKEKPDCVIAIQDIWGVDFCTRNIWWDKIASALWVTLDSRPILPSAIEASKKCKNFWNWNDFSTKEMHKLGLNHVKTVYGTIDCKPFYPLPNSKKNELRKRFNISENDVIFSFVGRNQLRKGFPNLIEGFSLFKKENPEVKNVKLLFHTHFFEGWPIPKFCEKFNIPLKEILTTYICRNCTKYEVKHFDGNDLDCKHCGAKKSQTTTSPGLGVTEEELNEVYNLSNFYIHPLTSGGLEIPFAIESKLCGLPGACTNYSCGEDFCEKSQESGTIPLDYDEYLEGTGTDFIKAWTKPSSIAKVMKKLYFMDKKEVEKMSKNARDFALKTFSVEVIGKYIENFIDSAELITDYSIFEDKTPLRDPNAQVQDSLNDEQWICSLYKDILKVEPDRGGGLNHWLNQIKNGMSREQVKECFKNIAINDNQKIGKTFNFEEFLIKNNKKKIIIVQPESAGDCFLLTSLFKSIRERYPREEWDFYVSSKKEYKEIFDGNPYIDSFIEYNQQMDNHIWLVGNKDHNGYFNVAYHPYFGTQRLLNYLSNGQDVIGLNLSEN